MDEEEDESIVKNKERGLPPRNPLKT